MIKELKIDPELRDLFPPLSKESLADLENSIVKKYDGTPIYTWHDYIADGHNRYPIFIKHNINFNIERVENFLGEDSTKADVAQWIVSYQRTRRNANEAELIYANSKVAEIIARENKEKVSKAVSEANRSRNSNSDHLDGNENIKTSHTAPTHTREQIARLAGVGTGTVSRYEKVMKSDDEELKRKMLNGEKKIGTAYREIKLRETPKETKIITPISENTQPKTYKEIANEYGGVQSSGHFGEYYNAEKTTDREFSEEDLANALTDAKTKKNVLELVNIKDEFDTLKQDVVSKIDVYIERIFVRYELKDKFTDLDKEYANDAIDEIILKLNKIKDEIKGENK